MKVDQIVFGVVVVSTIDTHHGSAIADPMLHGRDDFLATEQRGAHTLKALNHGRCVLVNDTGIFRVSLVNTTPAIVPRDCYRGCKCPVETGRCDLGCGDRTDLTDEIRIPCGA